MLNVRAVWRNKGCEPVNLLSKGLSLATVLTVLSSLASWADDTQWTDFVLPGTQTEGQYPYQAVFGNAPGASTMCPNGTLRTDAAWYRFCKCFGSAGCFVTYESVATYQCQNDESWHGKRFLVVTARGRTKKACGKVALQRTIDVIKDLGDAVNKINGSTDNYTWDVNLGTDTYDGDSEVVGKLDLQTGKRPDEKTKKVEEKKDEKKDTAKKETTEQKQTNTSGGGGTGTTNKKPRKQVAPSTNKTTSQNPNPNSNILPGVIELGVGVGLGMRHGGDRHGDDHGDFGGR